MANLQFSNGDIFPAFGLGTWLSKPGEVGEAVLQALRTGYRHIDCAYIYGNEKEIGNALTFAFENGIVTREELFITSKLWNSFHHPESVEPAIRKTLADLQLDYLDLYLIHWPLVFKQGHDQARSANDLLSTDEVPLADTWKAMEKIKRKGLTRHIGVSNFSIKKLDELSKQSETKPEVNQVEIHPFFTQEKMLRYCRENDIIVTAYSPLGSRHLIKTNESITQQQIIIRLAEKYNCTPAQIILAWGMARGYAVIPKSVNADRIIENIGALSVQLTDSEVKLISSMNRNQRIAKGLYAVLPGGCYTYANLWDE
ncbi:MAG: aldo/keto reductase [Paludibacter sp.]|jgi:alcohol dehydrogenase (NADP+)|nr:aldo/keto reductase [Paludibacter sp.]